MRALDALMYGLVDDVDLTLKLLQTHVERKNTQIENSQFGSAIFE